jgi:phenylacetate-CoA ligase
MLGFLKAYLIYPLAQRRLKRDILARLAVLQREARQPFSVRKQLALKRLVDALKHAGETVPYYRELFAGLHFDSDNVLLDIRYFQDLPWLTKDILMEQGPRMLSEKTQGQQLHERKTGSSTGPSAIIYYDQDALDWTAAENLLVLGWGGKKRHHKEVHLSTQFLEPLSPDAVRQESIKCFVLNRTNIYTGSFTPDALAPVAQQLRETSPRSVQGHPSTLYALARYVRNEKISAEKYFDIFVSTGEMTPRSVIMPRISRDGVTSNAGL